MKSILILMASAMCAVAQLIPSDARPPADKVASVLTEQLNQEVARRAFSRSQSWRMFWENPAATPAEIIAALGNRAVTVLTASTVDAAFFRALATSTGKPVSTFIPEKFLEAKEGFEITPRPDGTAEITTKP